MLSDHTFPCGQTDLDMRDRTAPLACPSRGLCLRPIQARGPWAPTGHVLAPQAGSMVWASRPRGCPRSGTRWRRPTTHAGAGAGRPAFFPHLWFQKPGVGLASHRSGPNCNRGTSHRPLDWGTRSRHWRSNGPFHWGCGARCPGAGGLTPGSERPWSGM